MKRKAGEYVTQTVASESYQAYLPTNSMLTVRLYLWSTLIYSTIFMRSWFQHRSYSIKASFIRSKKVSEEPSITLRTFLSINTNPES